MLYWSRVGAGTGTLKNPTKCLWRWEPDRRSYFFFSPPAPLCAVTYMTEISLIVTLNKQFNSTQLNNLTRLRIGHSRLTNTHYLLSEDFPECIPCDCRLSIKHVLIECIDSADIRKQYFNCTDLKTLFNSVTGDTI